MLDRLRPERRLHHVRRAGEGRVRVAAPDDGAGDEVAPRVDRRGVRGHGRERVGERRERLQLHVHERRRLTGRLPRHRGDRRQDVAQVARRLSLGHEEGPVRDDQALLAASRDVRGRDDGDDPRVSGRARDVDPAHDRAGDAGEPQRALEHAGRGEIADERLLAQRERPPLVPRGRSRDGHGEVPNGRRGPPPGRRHPLDRIDDRDVPGAPAQVPRERAGDHLARRGRLAPEEGLRLHDDPRRTVAALRGTRGDERLGPRVPGRVGQSLERLDRPARDACRRPGAGHHGPSVHDDRAGAARSLGRAAVLHRPQPERPAQDAEERFPGCGFDGDRTTVQRKVHRTASRPVPAGPCGPSRKPAEGES